MVKTRAETRVKKVHIYFLKMYYNLLPLDGSITLTLESLCILVPQKRKCLISLLKKLFVDKSNYETNCTTVSVVTIDVLK